MVEHAERMGCGNCGCKTFNIYQTHDKSQLYVECTKCNSVSVISVPTPKPKLEIDWGVGSEGILCVFGGD